MPIFIFLHSRQEPVIVRGERLDIWKRILLWFGFPVKFQSMQTDDIYNIPARSISHMQELPDAELQRRMAMQAENKKKNPNPGSLPKAIVPKGKP
jgi:hypothetical protein